MKNYGVLVVIALGIVGYIAYDLTKKPKAPTPIIVGKNQGSASPYKNLKPVSQWYCSTGRKAIVEFMVPNKFRNWQYDPETEKPSISSVKNKKIWMSGTYSNVNNVITTTIDPKHEFPLRTLKFLVKEVEADGTLLSFVDEDNNLFSPSECVE